MIHNNLLINHYHSFAIPEGMMCLVNTDLDIVHGFFANSFHVYGDVIMRKFFSTSEGGINNPDEMLIGEGVVVGVENRSE